MAIRERLFNPLPQFSRLGIQMSLRSIEKVLVSLFVWVGITFLSSLYTHAFLASVLYTCNSTGVPSKVLQRVDQATALAKEGMTSLFKASQLLEFTFDAYQYARGAAQDQYDLARKNEQHLAEFEKPFKNVRKLLHHSPSSILQYLLHTACSHYVFFFSVIYNVYVPLDDPLQDQRRNSSSKVGI